MSVLSRPRLILLEVAVAAVLIGLAYSSAWRPFWFTVAVLIAVIGLVTINRRPLYLVAWSWLTMQVRGGELDGTGIASLADGSYDVVTVPASESGGEALGAIREATTWTVPLLLPLDGVLNEDPSLPLDGLASLLRIEGVPFASVRIITQAAPALVPSPDVAGPVTPIHRFATRYLVLSLDTVHAADAIIERGGEPAIHQILRRGILRAEEVMAASGIAVRRLPQTIVEFESSNMLGPVTPGPDGHHPPTTETLDAVRISDSVSVSFTVTGKGAVGKIDQLTALLPVPAVVTSVVLQSGPTPHRPPTATLLLRISGPAEAIKEARRHLAARASELSLTVQRAYGDQVPLMKATTLLGVPSEAA